MASTFCGFMLVHGVHPNMVGVLAHVPWLLWVLDGVAARAGRPASIRAARALIGLLIGSQLLLGHPQSVWFSGLVGAAYAAHLMTAGPAGAVAASARTLVTGAALGLAVGAVQLLATLDAAAHSNRPAFDAASPRSIPCGPRTAAAPSPVSVLGTLARWNEVVAGQRRVRVSTAGASA